LILPALIGLLITLSYRKWQAIRVLREIEAQAFVDSLIDIEDALEILSIHLTSEKALGTWESDNAYAECRGFHAINTDELSRQSAAYSEDDTHPLTMPPFIEARLDGRTFEDKDLHEAFRGWDEGE